MRSRDIVRFVTAAVTASTLLALAVWLVPATFPYSPRSALALTPIIGVMLASRGVAWGRRLTFAGGLLGGFFIVDAVLEWTGAKRLALLSQGPESALMSVVYSVIALAVPLAVLFVFVGRDPSVLWTASQEGRRHRA